MRKWAALFGIALTLHAHDAAAQRLTPTQLYEAKQRTADLAARNQGDSALALLRDVAPQDSADARLWRRYAHFAAQQQQYLEAARAYEHVRRLGVFLNSMLDVEIARVYAQAGRPTTALDWLERALADRGAHPARVWEIKEFEALRDSARFRAIYFRGDSASLSRDEKWRRDIDFFLREAQRMHVHAERPAYSREFIDTIAALKSRVATSSDMQLALGLVRAAVLLRDGHSGVHFRAGVKLLPIDLYVFADGIFVVRDSGAVGRNLVGKRVVAIGGRPIDDVAKAVSAYIARDNPMGVLAWTPQALITVPYLDAAGLVNGDGSVEVQFEGARGERESARLSGGPWRRTRLPAPAGVAATPWWLDRHALYWTRDMPEANALYLNFNGVGNDRTETLAAFSKRLAQQLTDAKYRNLIVDTRLNGGGNTFFLPPLIQAIASFAATDTTRRVYVLTSRHTFSAAQNFVSKLEWLINPIFVGEPTGSAPNFAGEGSATVLPYSGLTIGISNRLHMNADWEDQRIWIAPQISVPLRSADYFRGRDPVLEVLKAVAGVGAI